MQRRFDDLVREYAQFGTLPTFVALACLVHHGTADDEGEASDLTVMIPVLPRRPSARTELMASLGTVYPLLKREGSAFAHVGIGRASNVDVQVPLSGISNYHAYVNIGPDGECAIADAGSQNGTYVMLQRLAPRQPAAIQTGTRIYLAQHAFTFFTRAGMLAHLRAQAAASLGGV